MQNKMRVAGALVATLLATLVVVAPSFADPAVGTFTCTAASGANRDVVLDLAVSGLAADATTTATLTVTVNGTPVDSGAVQLTSAWHYVILDAIPHGTRSATVSATVAVGSQQKSCNMTWSAFAVTAWSLPSGMTPGESGRVHVTVSSALDLSDYSGVLQYYSSGNWKDVATSAFSAGGTASFTMSAPQWRSIRVALLSSGENSDAPTWASSARVFDVKIAKPTIASKPSRVIQTYSGKVVVNYGSYATSGTATLERKSSTGTWTSVTKVALTHGTATMTFKPGATHTYRVAVKPKGLSTKYTPTFVVKYVPLLTVTAPASAMKNAMVTFTLTQYLAPPYYAKLQKLSGANWVTVKTFVVGNTVQKVTAKLTATSKWRVTAAGYASKTITVTAK